MARLSAGVSPHALIDAWMDWVFHMWESPDRQPELAKSTCQNVPRLASHLTRFDGDAAAPFEPKPL